MEQQTLQIKKTREKDMTLEEFEKMHSKPFLYILEQFEKWQALKQRKQSLPSLSKRVES